MLTSSPKAISFILSSRHITKTVLNCYYFVLNFINKSFVEICLPLLYKYDMVVLILPLGPQTLTYLVSGPLQRSRLVPLCDLAIPSLLGTDFPSLTPYFSVGLAGANGEFLGSES